MAQRRTRRGGQSSDAKEMRQKKLNLFIQQFEKEANSRIMEMERKMEDMLATADRIFKVELLKMPPSLQSTRLADLRSAEDVSAGDITIAMQTECPELNQPLTKKSSKRVKQNDGPNQTDQTQKKTKALKGKEGAKTTRTLGTSNSTGSLRTTAKRTGGRRLKISDQSMVAIPKSRSKLSSASEGDGSCSAMGSSSQITLTTSHGEMLSFSEEAMDDDLDLLDDVARHQIQMLTELIYELRRKAKID